MLISGRVKVFPCSFQAPCSLRAFRRIAPLGALNRRLVLNRRRVSEAVLIVEAEQVYGRLGNVPVDLLSWQLLGSSLPADG